MKFTLAIVAALASSAFAVVQRCKAAGLTPYCCDSVLGLGGIAPFAVGIGCTEEPFGKKTTCPSSNQEKQCCEVQSSTFGFITMCQTGGIGI